MAFEDLVLPIVLLAIFAAPTIIFLVYARRYKKVPPNMAMVVFGRQIGRASCRERVYVLV